MRATDVSKALVLIQIWIVLVRLRFPLMPLHTIAVTICHHMLPYVYIYACIDSYVKIVREIKNNY